MKLKTPLEEFEDKYHPVHLYCRLRDLGIEDDLAYRTADIFDRHFYKRIIKYVRDKKC